MHKPLYSISESICKLQMMIEKEIEITKCQHWPGVIKFKIRIGRINQ